MKQFHYTQSPGREDALQGTELIFQIQDSAESMPKTYRKIAAYILNDPDSLSRFTISQLAKKIGVCSSSITRFCQSLGYSGYPQFKFSVTQRNEQVLPDNHTMAEAGSLAAVKQKLLTNYTQSLEKTVQSLTPQLMDRVVALILKANRIYFFSHGGSSASAQLGQIMFMQIGIPAASFTEISLSAMAASQLKRGDIAIGISSSGNAKTPVDALQIAKSHGATTIGITGFSNTHLAYYSDILLCYNLSIEDIRLMHVGRICEAAVLGVIQNWLLKKSDVSETNSRLYIAKEAMMSARYI